MIREHDFYVVRATPRGESVDFAIVGIENGTLGEVEQAILANPIYPPGSFILLEKNEPVVVKPNLPQEVAI